MVHPTKSVLCQMKGFYFKFKKFHISEAAGLFLHCLDLVVSASPEGLLKSDNHNNAAKSFKIGKEDLVFFKKTGKSYWGNLEFYSSLQFRNSSRIVKDHYRLSTTGILS